MTTLVRPNQFDVSLLASTGLLQLGANAAAALVATVALGPAGRGEMVLGATISSVCALVGGMGTGQALRSVLPAAGAADRARLLRSYAWCAAGLAVGACVASAPLTGPALASPGLLVAVAAATAVGVVMLAASDVWYADGLFRCGGLWAAACAAGGFVAVTAVATLVGSSTGALLAAQAAGSALVCLAQLRGLRRTGLLGVVAGPAAVGVYSLAATLSEVFRVVPQAVGQLFVRHVALGGGRLAGWVWRAALCSAVGGVVVAAVGCYVVGVHLGGSVGLAASCVLLYCGLSAGAVMLFRRPR